MSANAAQRVLVVDDEPQVLVALEDLLRDQFFVLTADSAERALAVARREPDIAVVLTDQRMPGMSGDELLTQLAGSLPAERILLTGYANVAAVVRAVNEGRIFAYATKPWNPDDLRIKVAKAAERYRLATELTHERELLNRVLGGMADGVIAASRSGELLLFNLQAERLLGIQASRFDPRTWLEACGVHEPDERTPLDPARDPLRHAMDGRPQGDCEIFVKNARVEGAFLSVASAELRDEARAVVGGVLVLRDITDRRRLESELAQAHRVEALGMLAGGVAHDFNNMLAVITGHGELLLGELAEDDARRPDLLQMLTGARRAAGLTRQLLTFSRKQVRRLEIVNVNQIVAGMRSMLERVIGEDIALFAELSPDLWPVRADVSQLEQVLLNLTANARDAMPSGGRFTIQTANVAASAAGEGRVRLAVTDTGVGVDDQTRLRMFEPFFTTKEPGRGTGLGLATVQRIVQELHGELRVTSTVGQGTTFVLDLPAAPGLTPAGLGTRRSLSPIAEGGASILVVEDEDAVRKVTARLLRQRGYAVLEARLPGDALELCERESTRVNLLLADVVMPQMAGPELAERLRRMRPDLRVLYASGYSASSVAERGVNVLGAAYLEKPFSAEALYAEVAAALYGPTSLTPRSAP